LPRVWSRSPARTQELTETIELNGLPDGMYLLRLSVDGRVVTRKLVKKSGR